MTYKTKHFAVLERCSCGAYRYIAMREKKRLYEVLLIHQLGKVRKYRKVTSIEKSALDFHRAGNITLRDGDSLLLASLELSKQLSAFVTALQKGDKNKNDNQSAQRQA